MLQKMRVFCVTCGLIALGLGCVGARDAEAGELPSLQPYFTQLQLPAGRAELSNGFDKTANGWSGYSTAVVALTGPLHVDGWRVKLSGGYGSYHYKSRSVYCQLSAEEKKQRTGTNFGAICNDIAGNPPEGEERDALATELAATGLELEGDQIYAVTSHLGARYDAVIAPGYQFTLGAVIMKAYLGLGYELHQVTPPDSTKPLSGSYWGARAGLETWVPLGEEFWISGDASYFTGTNAHAASMKMGYKAQPWLSLGPEFSTYGNVDDTSGRAGAFLRLDALGVETTLAGGLSGTYKDDPSAYGSASVYMKF
jgi:hypothetical protein